MLTLTPTTITATATATASQPVRALGVANTRRSATATLKIRLRHRQISLREILEHPPIELQRQMTWRSRSSDCCSADPPTPTTMSSRCGAARWPADSARSPSPRRPPVPTGGSDGQP
jgi:hypothetical protein